MKTLIAYRSKYGTVAACARAVAQRITTETVVVDLAQKPWPDPSQFDVVLIGGSIYTGRIQRDVRAFCEKNRQALMSRPVGLYICCMYQGDQAQAQLQGAYPGWLSSRAFVARSLGGELHRAKLSWFDRFLLLGLSRSTMDVMALDPVATEAVAAACNGLTRQARSPA